MLGTNDAQKGIWNEQSFIDGYYNLIKVFKELISKPKVFLTIPPPMTVGPLSDLGAAVN